MTARLRVLSVFFAVFVLSAVVSFVGCGGGGNSIANSTSTPTQTPTPTPTPTVSNVWTWVGGTDSSGGSGTYGTLGVASPANLPAARFGAVQWTDKAGNFWLFGGNFNGADSTMNDLWKYDPSANAWTWVSGTGLVNGNYNPPGAGTYGAPQGICGTQGVPSTANTPGARAGSVGWTDADGNLWLFGGGDRNDLWKFNPSDKTWTWVGGSNECGNGGLLSYGNYGTLGVEAPTNWPPPRSYAASWIDNNGNFWLFGGPGLNDIWKFNRTTNRWTWMGGSNTYNTPVGSHGTQGVPSSSTVPPNLEECAFWKDGQGNFWLFGGVGIETGGAGYFFSSDIWKFSPDSNMWTWMGSTSGNFGTQGEGSPANGPSARFSAVTWTDSKGNLWLFGGSQYSPSGDLNDLWKLDPTTMTWTWVNGSQNVNTIGVYGTKNTISASNVPSGTSGAVGWIDKSDNLWVFGGTDHNTSLEFPDDLWRYQP